MIWTDIKDQLPERDQKCLVYCHKATGLHLEGVYMAWYVKPHDREDFYFLIDDKSGIDNNYKHIANFSHWMEMPGEPVKDSYGLIFKEKDITNIIHMTSDRYPNKDKFAKNSTWVVKNGEDFKAFCVQKSDDKDNPNWVCTTFSHWMAMPENPK